MKTSFKALFVAIATLAASTAFAQVKVENPWVRASVPHQQATGGFFNITSETNAKLVGASSTLLPTVEIHEMSMENNVMKMRQVQSIDLPAGQTVELKPGSYHLMFFNLKEQVKEGSVVPLTLEIENSDGTKETVSIEAPVKALTSAGNGHQKMHMKH